MNIFEQISNNIDNVYNNIESIIVGSMVAEKEAIIDLNIDQIESGMNADGGIIGEYAQDEYSQLKQAMGSKAPFGIVDLKLEGDFIEGIYAEEDKTSGDPRFWGLFIDSKDEKTPKLERKYDGIFGIAPDNTDELQEITLEPILNELENELTKLN